MRKFALFLLCLIIFAFISDTTYAQVASPTPTLTMLQKSDINGDGAIDPIDFGILGDSWGKTDAQLLYWKADINGDGVVNLIDLAIFSSNYGKVP